MLTSPFQIRSQKCHTISRCEQCRPTLHTSPLYGTQPDVKWCTEAHESKKWIWNFQWKNKCRTFYCSVASCHHHHHHRCNAMERFNSSFVQTEQRWFVCNRHSPYGAYSIVEMIYAEFGNNTQHTRTRLLHIVLPATAAPVTDFLFVVGFMEKLTNGNVSRAVCRAWKIIFQLWKRRN